MADFQMDMISDPPAAKPSRPAFQMPSFIGLLSPAQRLILSVFLFMDVCILAFAVLFLFGKMSLPV
jgi:hypothetical protein